MKNEIFRGSATALVTPFTKTGDINYEVLKELINFQIQNQTKALIILGTTGEAATISLKEKIEIVKCAVQHVNRRV
ncbi:MAG: dihydrodipicolinate synthase family protein, partial [Clostridia bacterium]|nr:dihydrodipicolinate synthase family protein [Clostridia bacterium]